MTPTPPVLQANPAVSSRDTALKEAAIALEASFLAEMLKSAGMGEGQSSFGGGTGEDQFASFLVDEHAKLIAQTGGIGLAESLYDALKERENG